MKQNYEYPLVSAIITTYKRDPRFVLRAIESIMHQTYPNIETIVVDDSPDDYPKRSEVEAAVNAVGTGSIRYIANMKNLGACASRNIGIQASKGEYIALLDDDDEWLPDKIEKQVNAFTNEAIGLVTCDAFYCYDDGRKELRANKVVSDSDVFDQLLISNFVGGCSFPMIRRECFEKCGMFKPDLPSSQDKEMFLRVAKRYRLYFIREPLLNYYAHTGERIGGSISKKIEAFRIIDDIYTEYFISHPLIYKKRTESEMRYCLKHGNIKSAQAFCKKMVSNLPNQRHLYFVIWFRLIPVMFISRGLKLLRKQTGKKRVNDISGSENEK